MFGYRNYFNIFLVILFTSLFYTRGVIAEPFEQQTWSGYNFSTSFPNIQDGNVGTKSVRVEVNGVPGTRVFGNETRGSLLNQPTSFLVNPDNLNWFRVAAFDFTSYTISFTGLSGPFIDIGEVFTVYQLNGTVNTSNPTSINNMVFRDMSDNTLLAPVFSTSFQQIDETDSFGDGLGLLTYDPVLASISMETPVVYSRSGALYLINTTGTPIKSISFDVNIGDTPLFNDDSLFFGVATPVPEPSTYLLLGGMLSLLFLIAKYQSNRRFNT